MARCLGPVRPAAMIGSWLTIALVTFVGIMPIANPFGAAVVFLTITENCDAAKRQRQALMACIYMAGILITFLLLGSLIMNFFGISLPGLRIAGGLIVARLGFGMLSSTPEKAVADDSQAEAREKQDIAFTPLAMPMLSGPGSIAVTIGMAADASGPAEIGAIGVGIVMVAFVSFLVLRVATQVVRVLGTAGTNAMGRIMGFLLVCVGIQFVVDGTQDILASPEFWVPILAAIQG